MTILNLPALARFTRQQPAARRPLEAWVTVAEAAEWSDIIEVRLVYPHADAVKTDNGTIATVFNVGGNKYRLVTVIVYALQTVRVAEVLTHAEYEKDQWKRRV